MPELSEARLGSLSTIVRFYHDGKEFLYTFYLDGGKISFERKQPGKPSIKGPAVQKDRLYPAGDRRLVSVAVIALFKGYDGTKVQSSLHHKILPSLVGTISKEAWPSELKLSVKGFGGKIPVADVDLIMGFIKPFSNWNPRSTETSINSVSSSLLSSPPESIQSISSSQTRTPSLPP